MYRIKSRQFKNAKKLGVTIKPSKSKAKKIDVFKNCKQIASIGGRGYKDYATYISEKGLEFANKRKKLYKTSYFSSFVSFPSRTAMTSPSVISW